MPTRKKSQTTTSQTKRSTNTASSSSNVVRKRTSLQERKRLSRKSAEPSAYQRKTPKQRSRNSQDTARGPKTDNRYYYLTFPSTRKVDKFTDLSKDQIFYIDHPKTIRYLKKIGVSFAYSTSPSGCYAYRVERTLEHDECTIYDNIHPGFAPMYLPVVFQGGGIARFPMNYVLSLPMLWKTWTRSKP